MVGYMRRISTLIFFRFVLSGQFIGNLTMLLLLLLLLCSVKRACVGRKDDESQAQKSYNYYCGNAWFILINWRIINL